MEEMLKKLDICFDRLQNLDVRPTEHNMSVLLQTLYDLRDVYQYIKGGDGVGRSADHAE